MSNRVVAFKLTNKQKQSLNNFVKKLKITKTEFFERLVCGLVAEISGSPERLQSKEVHENVNMEQPEILERDDTQGQGKIDNKLSEIFSSESGVNLFVNGEKVDSAESIIERGVTPSSVVVMGSVELVNAGKRERKKKTDNDILKLWRRKYDHVGSIWVFLLIDLKKKFRNDIPRVAYEKLPKEWKIGKKAYKYHQYFAYCEVKKNAKGYTEPKFWLNFIINWITILRFTIKCLADRVKDTRIST